MPAFKKLLNDPVKKRRAAFLWFWSDVDHFLGHADEEAFELVAAELRARMVSAPDTAHARRWGKVGERLLSATVALGMRSMDELSATPA